MYVSVCPEGPPECPPPLPGGDGSGRAFREGGVMSDLCRVCLVFPPPVSIFGLFPALVSCHYELIRFQVCVICECVNSDVNGVCKSLLLDCFSLLLFC